jgi:hypothetical protein
MLIPVWVSPVLVTTDGPSHVYNAAVADAVRAARGPWATAFAVQPGRATNNAAAALLETGGARVGWERAERGLVTLAILATFAALLVAAGVHTTGAVPASIVPLAAWLAQSWFLWTGFYDFALSLAGFAALVIALGARVTVGRWVVGQGVLALLFFTHFFAFAAGVGVLAVVLGWQARRRALPWWSVAGAVPGLVMVAVQLGGGAAGAGGIQWGDPIKAVAGLAVGDFVLSHHPVSVAGGLSLVVAVLATLATRLRAARAAGPLVTGLEIAALLMLAGSLVAPFGLGEGSYIPARLRALAAFALLPAVAAWCPRAVLRAAGAVGGLALVASAAAQLRAASRVADDVERIADGFVQAGAQPGAWVRTSLADHERGLFRVSAYAHLVERVALRRDYVVLDNYEAQLRIFPVTWRATPDWLALTASRGGWTARLMVRDARWSTPVFVVHEADRPLASVDAGLEVGPAVAAGPFHVTAVRRRLP